MKQLNIPIPQLLTEKWGQATAATRPPTKCTYCGDVTPYRSTRFDGPIPYCSSECLLDAANSVPIDTPSDRTSASLRYNNMLVLLLRYIEKGRVDKVKQFYPKLLKFDEERRKIVAKTKGNQKNVTTRRAFVDGIARQLGIIT